MNIRLDKTFETAQGSVRYGVFGDGKPLILVHGTPWSSFTYQYLASTLSKSFKIYCYDLIGYGASEMYEGQTVSLDIQGQVLTNLIQHWDLDKPNVVAHDFGGAISLRAHLLHGVDFAKLCLMNVVALSPWGSPFFAHVRKHEKAFVGVPQYIHAAILETYIKGALFKDLKPEDILNLSVPWLTEEGQAAFYRQIAQADQKYTDEIEPLYDAIRCPVRILWGENDKWIPIETGKRLQSTIPGSEFFPIKRAGHLVQMDAPEEVVQKILEFMM